jgi:hypothetical protein
MNRFGLLICFVLVGCAPKYLSGSTECSTKNECPSGYFCGSNGTSTRVCFQSCSASRPCEGGFVCGNDGINTLDVCMDRSETDCISTETYYCKQADMCWSSAIACSTITDCGTANVPDHRACTSPTLRPDCNGSCVEGTGLGGSGGSAGSGGSGGSKTGGAGGSATGGTTQDAGTGSKDAGVACSTSASCQSGQQCLGGQCCVPPATGGECNHYPACGCPSGKVCYPSSLEHTLACVTAGNLAEGADCTSGSSCQSGLGCFGGTCKRYCNADGDCPAVAGLRSCLQTAWSDDSTSILGVKVCGRICDPAHPQSPTPPLLPCPAGFACQSSSVGLSYCFEANPLPTGSVCSQAEDCAPGTYCSQSGSCNRYCLSTSDCSGSQTCHFGFSPAQTAGTSPVGFCS